MISPLEDIQIMPVKVNQAGEDEPFCQAKGFYVITGEKKFYIFVICGDIVKGNKLLVSMAIFYGRLVLIDQNEAIIRIK